MKTMQLENAEIQMQFDPARLFARIAVKKTNEYYCLDVAKNAWVRLADARGEWCRRGTAVETLPKTFLTPDCLRRVVHHGDRIRLEFQIQGIVMAADLCLTPAGFLECRLYPTDDSRQAVVDGVFPGPLWLERMPTYSVVFPRAQGVLFVPGKEPYTHVAQAVGQSMTMRWFGGIGRKSAYLCIADQPEDAQYHLHYAPRSEFTTYFQWTSSLGTLRYTRRMLYGFCSEPSYVRLAKRFRQYAERKGLIVSLKEKLEACPQLERLWGGVFLMLGYFNDPKADYRAGLQIIRAMGISRALVYPARMDGCFTNQALAPCVNLSPALIRVVKKLGYLSGVFFCPCDIHNGHPLAEAVASRQNPADTTDRKVSWQIDDATYYRTHFGKVLERFDRLFDFAGLDDVHFDVLGNAAGTIEDYSPDWPQTRREHTESARAMARYFLDQGKLVSCEGKTDSLVSVLHWGSFRRQVVPQYALNDQEPTFLHPIPLWQLVFHDVMFHSSWEHHTYNDGCHNGAGNPVVGYLHDLLYGDLPSVFPMGRLYRYVPNKKKVEYYSIRFNSQIVRQSLKLAGRAAEHHREIGMCRMVSHRSLDERRLVQETVFENGRRVLVNFSDRRFQADGCEIPAKDVVRT